MGRPPSQSLRRPTQGCDIPRLQREQRRLTQVEAAKLLGVDQAKVSALVCGRLSGFSTDRLFRFLNAPGRDVEVVVRPKPKSRKQAQLRVAS
ncbi:MAG: XRE family transcriptional regulator [Candidatus Hydrogenedentes bacterium]|nr:XRE family transcriptional regulator [Candidatus Hydrogenedentota bacterium]